ncbi:MAG: hypothetical protein ACKVVP_12560, partial [Chloroflexota bacterium]
TMSVTTDGGTGYLVRAPNVASIAMAQTGSRFKATGSVVNGVFVATAIEILPATSNSQPAAPIQQTPIVGIIIGLDTGANPPRVVIDTGAGTRLTVILPGASRVTDLQIGASITASGNRQGDVFTATSFTVLSQPGDDQNENDDGNDNDDSADNDDSNDNGDSNENDEADNFESNDNGNENDNFDVNDNSDESDNTSNNDNDDESDNS